MADDKLQNRIEQIRRDDDTVRNTVITLETVDTAILNHIKNVIKPTFEENGTIKPVPVFFASPERWRSIQADGWFRDQQSKQIMVPVMSIARGSFSKNSTMAMDKIDGVLRKTVASGYNTKNRYDIFSVANKLRPTKVHYSVTVPDYVVINYEISIWTAFIRQMNEITEKFVYAESSYWGGRYDKFRVMYDTIDNTIEVNEGQNRAVRNTFTISVNAYIIPKSFNNKDTTIKVLEPAKIVISAEVVNSLDGERIETQREVTPVQFITPPIDSKDNV
ncbi:MAG: hypothetical protein JETCAE03_33410 [Ignavibacteriaceae bacterium]|nr:MAG: hypothetical protein JETCAE03_33410 [Ignavibacteriaceae bacterium]